MAKSEVRKPAPPVVVEEVFRDDRAAMLAELGSKDPEFVYSFQRSNINPDEFRRKGMEIVKDESGKELGHETDIVVRQPKEIYQKRKTAESNEAFRGGSKIVSNPDDIRQHREPKKIRMRKEED